MLFRSKHVLGIQEGATENATAAKALLVHLREHGVSTEKNYLFVIDGAKALRAALREVFGAGPAVQRCRNHKVRNVLDQLPKEQHAQVRSLLRAAYKMENAADGMVLRWAAAGFLITEKSFGKIQGYRDLAHCIRWYRHRCNSFGG